MQAKYGFPLRGFRTCQNKLLELIGCHSLSCVRHITGTDSTGEPDQLQTAYPLQGVQTLLASECTNLTPTSTDNQICRLPTKKKQFFNYIAKK